MHAPNLTSSSKGAEMKGRFACAIILGGVLIAGGSSPKGLLRERRDDQFTPTECNASSLHGFKSYDTRLVTKYGIKSEKTCSDLCLQFKGNGIGSQCTFANYFPSKRICELMLYSNAGKVVPDPSCIILVPDCENKTEATSASTRISAGTFENPFPGTCGQTSVSRNGRSARLPKKVTFQRIVGGLEADPHSIPFIVSLRLGSFFHYCGGSLIRVNEEDESDIVVTAAHCVSLSANRPSFNVFAGAHYISKKEGGEETVRALKVIIHPSYRMYSVSRANDIALVKLSRPIKFSRTIQPVCLPAQGERVKDGTSGIIAGWGLKSEWLIWERVIFRCATPWKEHSSKCHAPKGPSKRGMTKQKDGFRRPEALMRAAIPAVGYSKCKRVYGGGLIDGAMLCGGFGRQNICLGDSGGPYLFQGENGYTLQGLVSSGRGCGIPGIPSVFTRVSTYVDWIQQQARALSSVRT